MVRNKNRPSFIQSALYIISFDDRDFIVHVYKNSIDIILKEVIAQCLQNFCGFFFLLFVKFFFFLNAWLGHRSGNFPFRDNLVREIIHEHAAEVSNDRFRRPEQLEKWRIDIHGTNAGNIRNLRHRWAIRFCPCKNRWLVGYAAD
jgi:hypothetical protein